MNSALEVQRKTCSVEVSLVSGTATLLQCQMVEIGETVAAAYGWRESATHCPCLGRIWGDLSPRHNEPQERDGGGVELAFLCLYKKLVLQELMEDEVNMLN